MKQSTLDDIDALLADTDELLSTRYPGDRDVRQPIHTVYVPGHQADPTVPRQWGEQALAAVEDNGGMVQLAERVIVAARREADETLGLPPPSLHQVAREAELLAEAVTRKVTTEPIEDLRYDFEDGFGDQSDEAEDAAVREAARAVVAGMAEDTAPAFVGIRFKCLEAVTRARGLRTLDLFVSGVIAAHGSLPEGLVLTLPKVSTADQVTAMV
ncbi:aldolase, partial [Burkholderia multivorans]